MAAWPVFVVADIQESLQFRVAVDEADYSSIFQELGAGDVGDQSDATFRRRYKTQEVRRRLHQAKFRERVLRAYQEKCAMCRLAHRGLLDAAHIIPDSANHGEASVSNGLALCKIHHAAFDQFFVGISPDLRIVVRKRLLEEVDGPMLRHGLQELNGLKITVPRSSALRPSTHSLAYRFSEFERRLLDD